MMPVLRHMHYRPKQIRSLESNEVAEYCVFDPDEDMSYFDRWCEHSTILPDTKEHILKTADRGIVTLKRGDIVFEIPNWGYIIMTLKELNDFLNGDLN